MVSRFGGLVEKPIRSIVFALLVEVLDKAANKAAKPVARRFRIAVGGLV